MPLTAAEHRAIDGALERFTKERRNRAHRDHLAQVRGRELATLRRRNAHLEAQLHAAQRLFSALPPEGVDPETWAALRAALELD